MATKIVPTKDLMVSGSPKKKWEPKAIVTKMIDAPDNAIYRGVVFKICIHSKKESI